MKAPAFVTTGALVEAFAEIPGRPSRVVPDPDPWAQPRGVKRIALIALGWFSVALGVIGIFLPIMPTTCFLLAAAWAFGKSSPRFHAWLMTNRVFGPYLSTYQKHRSVPKLVKAGSLAMLWASIGTSLVVIGPPTWATLLLLSS